MINISNTFIINKTEIYKANTKDKINYVSALMKIQKDLKIKDKESFSAIELYKYELVENEFCVSEKVTFFKWRFSLLIDSLYIFAFNDKRRGRRIVEYIKSQVGTRYHNRLENVFQAIYNGNSDEIPSNILIQFDNWNKNKNFQKLPITKVAIVANMSAGKSTLINAMVGKEVNKSQNLSCTSKIHYIYNKPYDDGYISEDDDELCFNASFDTLMDDNENNTTAQIMVGVGIDGLSKRVCLIDTPGVNSANDKGLDSISKKFVRQKDYDYIVYVINANGIATSDDESYLRYVCKNAKKNSAFFALNKIDSFSKKDSVEDSINRLKDYLSSLGFEKPVVFPISAQTAFLKRLELSGVDLNEDDEDDLYSLSKKLKQDRFSLEKYTPVKIECQNDEVIIKSGIINLEQFLFKGE